MLVGSVNGGHAQDRYFKLDYEEGPFKDIKSFNDWLGMAATRQRPGPNGIIRDPYRDFLPDTGEVYFTHGDLTPGNIIISDTPSTAGTREIVGVIDWEQAGWYPEYWEYCKLLCGVPNRQPWCEEGWANGVVRPFDDEWEAVGEYYAWRGFP